MQNVSLKSCIPGDIKTITVNLKVKMNCSTLKNLYHGYNACLDKQNFKSKLKYLRSVFHMYIFTGS